MILLLAISFASAQLGPEEKKVGANKVRCQIANMTGPIGVPYVVPDKSDNVSAWDTVERERDNLTACNDRADLKTIIGYIKVVQENAPPEYKMNESEFAAFDNLTRTLQGWTSCKAFFVWKGVL